MIEGIGLVRVSTEAQADETHAGIPAQRHAIQAIAQGRGIELVQIFEITDVSGSRILSAPEFQAFLHCLEKSSIQAVVTKEFSRLMRPDNFGDYIILQAFVDNEITLHLPDGPVDFSSKFGKFIGTLRAGMAGMELEEIRRRMQDGKEAMRRAGKHPCGSHTLPKGLAYSKDEGWYYTEDIERVKEIFRLFLTGGHNLAEISRRVEIPRSTVAYALHNPAYSGWMIYDQKRDMSVKGYVPRPDGRQGHRKKVKREPNEIIRFKLPLKPLITESEFRSIQILMDGRRRFINEAKSKKQPQFVFNGYLLCDECKSPLYTHTNTRDFFYYCASKHTRIRRKRELENLPHCTNRYMLRDKLEPKINAIVEKRLTNPAFLSRVIKRHLKEQVESYSDLDPNHLTIKSSLDSLEQKRARVLESFYDGVITGKERDQTLQVIAHEIDALKRIKPGKKRDLPFDLKGIGEIVSVFQEWSFLSRQQKRRLLDQLVPAIFIYHYKVKGITLKIDCKNDNPLKRVKSPSVGQPVL